MDKSLYNKFKQDLGISDAINEYIEVLLRQFESTPHDEGSFQLIASRYGIRVNDVDPQTAISKIREYYIISVFQVFEDFLGQMHNYLKDYGEYNGSKDSSDSMLKHIHKNLIGMKRTSEISYLNYLICDYYRLIRNLCAHTDNTNKVQSAHQYLLERKEEIEAAYPQLQSPNDFQQINFDDFVLYSRAAKDLAEEYVSNIKYDTEKFISKFDVERFRCNHIIIDNNVIFITLLYYFACNKVIVFHCDDKIVIEKVFPVTAKTYYIKRKVVDIFADNVLYYIAD